MIRVAIADDQALVRSAFALLLRSDPQSSWSARPPTASRPSSSPGASSPT